MAPEPRSSETARQGREYRSTGSTKQVRFPTRRRRVRGQSNGIQKREVSSLKRESSSLKQQTLTQMSFVSSFGEDATLMDDNASDEDGTAYDKSGLTVPQRESKSRLTTEPQELTTREDTVIIQDSCGSTYDSSGDDDDDDASAGVNISPPRWPEDVREAATAPPRSVSWADSLNIVRDSPRRRAHLRRNLEELRSTQSSQEEGTALSAHVHFAATEADDREIPDSDEDDEELQLRDFNRLIHQETLYAGHETQLILEELASLEHPELTPGNSSARRQLMASQNSLAFTPSNGTTNNKNDFSMEDTQTQHTAIPQTPAFSLPSSPSSPKTQVGSDDQTNPSQGQKFHTPAHTELPSQGQIFESQRVPLHILQSLAPVSARTDILLPTPSEVLDLIISGSESFLHLAYRVPEQVQRFWLFSLGILRYMACIQPGRPRGHGWDYRIDQVYQLNNALEERDMQEEGWVNGTVQRYIYLPPAIAGQLLWNLRCATFDDGELQRASGDDGRDDISQVSDYRSSSRKDTRSSAATLQSAETDTYINDHDAGQPSSLIFQDHGSSAATLPASAVLGSSPLLTKSQMLSDSLISDKL